uniref:Uncharacterized protein n=1 Tax=Oryza rufipogon TaxID=4529 RepID=A0A0E0Q1H7_ORYRU
MTGSKEHHRMPMHIDIVHRLCGGQLVDLNRVNAGPDHNRGVPANVMVNNAVEENTIPDGGSLAWSGYAMIVLSVLALWSGFVSEPVAVFLAFVLLLLGCGFLHVAMLAPSKPKML